MDWVDLFTGFHGRISRQPFWIGVLVLAVVETICQAVSHRIEGDRLGSIVDLAFSYPEFALTLKRAHDRNPDFAPVRRVPTASAPIRSGTRSEA